jgi:hypothetical protein
VAVVVAALADVIHTQDVVVLVEEDMGVNIIATLAVQEFLDRDMPGEAALDNISFAVVLLFIIFLFLEVVEEARVQLAAMV